MRLFSRYKRLKLRSIAVIAVAAIALYYIYSNWYAFTSWETPDELFSLRKKRYVEYQNGELKRTGPGELGEGVMLEGEEKAKAEKLMTKEAFNIVASDKIALDRGLKDVRDPE